MSPLRLDWEVCFLHSWHGAFLPHGLSGAFLGDRKFRNLLIWVLAFEVAGTPFGYHKFSGGFSVAFVGCQLQNDACQVGISDRRGRWLLEWIDRAQADSFVVVSRDFSEV